ncbi:MAG TPA: DHA2 family efflux MFS transporter permease subunit [Opitutaceae bacterium]|jgi:DHA2 family multidrug resistance protein|nr:DHA2 family efflux MFS transporter permease subunit [Opitutaceae bacterium]
MAGAQEGLYGSDFSRLSPFAASLARKGTLKWIIALTASLGAILEVIDTSIVNVALPDIQGNLGATLSEVGWISTGYACANVVIIPLSAWLGYRFGKKNYMLFSLIGFTAASALCGLAPNLPFLIFARVLQGLAGGGLLAKAQAILFETFPPREQPMAQALFGIGVIAGPAFGPVLGGYLTDTLGWRWIFFINLPVGIVAVLMTMAFLPADREDETNRDRVDWTGLALLTMGLACLQTLLEQGQDDDWFSSHFIVAMAAGSVIGLGLFIWRELSIDYPVVDLRVLRHRSLAAGSAYSLVLGMGIYGVIFAIPVFVQDYLHFSATQSGLLQMPTAIASALTMVAMGKISGRFDARALIGIGALTTVAAAFGFASINPDTGASSLFWPLMLRAIGSVCMFLPLSLATLGSLPRDKVSAGAGFYNLTRQLGSSIGIALITTILAQREAVHRAGLVEKISAYQPATLARLQLYGGVFARHSADPVVTQLQTYSLVDNAVNSQALLLSFADVFRYVGLAFIFTLPLLLLLGKGRTKGISAAH